MSKLARLSVIEPTMDSFFPATQNKNISALQSKADVSVEKMAIARKRAQIVSACLDLMHERKLTKNKAAKHLHDLFKSQKHQFYSVALDLGKSNSVIGKATIVKWLDRFQSKGLLGLVDERKGKQKLDKGWELRAVKLFAKPQQPSFQLVVDQLIEEGFTVDYHSVRRYLHTLPTDMTTFSHGRLGAKYNNLNTRKYKLLDDSNIPVGYCFQGDGHECDVWVAHPNTGDIMRPELTAWIDIRSRYITGHWLGYVENSTDTLFALSHAMTKHNHVPSLLHIDNGSGYKSHMLNEDHVGFYTRFDIETMFAIPGNSKGKGRIERWFKTFEIKFGKRFDTYCGKDMSGEVLRDITKGVKNGTYQLPSFEDFKYRAAAWIEEYNNTPHRSLNGLTPAQVWADLQQTELVTPTEAVVLPVKKRVVRRTGVALDKRLYRHDELLHHEGKEVQVQYSVHTDGWVRILTLEGYWLCDAPLATKTPYIPDSRIQEGMIKSLKGKQKRLDIKRDENEKRAILSLGVEPDLTSLDILNQPLLTDLDDFDNTDSTEDSGSNDTPTKPSRKSNIVIDITDTSWADED